MKAVIYTLGILFSIIFLGSCKSVQTLVDSGQYDEAIHLATRKMRGDKVKKTKHIKSLERAFLRVNENDLEEISFLKNLGHLDAYERIYDIAERISYRQKLVSPYLPLISKDGYRGRFDFIDEKSLLIETGNKITELSYERGLEYLALFDKHRDRKYAREAYYSFRRCEDFIPDYKNLISLISEAGELGIDHVKIETVFDNDLFLPYHITEYLDEIQYTPEPNKWIKYYTDQVALDSFDYIARLIIRDVAVSPEREVSRIFVEEKEIEDGTEYVLDENGNVAKDTLGNDIKRPKYAVVKARIKEISREKSLGISGEMEIVEMNSNHVIRKPISAEAFFEDLSYIVRGDRRALSRETRKRVKDFPLDFPSDIELLFETGDEIKRAFRYELDKMTKRISA